MPNINKLERAITILRALKNEYAHPEVKEACDIAIESIEQWVKFGEVTKRLSKNLYIHNNKSLGKDTKK